VRCEVMTLDSQHESQHLDAFSDSSRGSDLFTTPSYRKDDSKEHGEELDSS